MLEESVVYQDVLQQGRQAGNQETGASFLLSLISHRFGRVPLKRKEQITSLPLKQTEKLFRAAMDFKDKTELFDWLDTHSSKAARKRN